MEVREEGGEGIPPLPIIRGGVDVRAERKLKRNRGEVPRLRFVRIRGEGLLRATGLREIESGSTLAEVWSSAEQSLPHDSKFGNERVGGDNKESPARSKGETFPQIRQRFPE